MIISTPPKTLPMETGASDRPLCPHCAKPDFLCICAETTPIATKTAVLILQHPQEQDRWLGTGRLTARQLAHSKFKIGLSWPSLTKALEEPADPSEWAVLHLGAMRSGDLPPDREAVVLDKKGVVSPDQDRALAALKGVVIFDGTWSQAKTLWWRNAWVLKARRLVLNPRQASLYGALRREPRREGLSTIEAAALALGAIEKRPEINVAMRAQFALMLERYRLAEEQGLLQIETGVAKAKTPHAQKRRPARRSKPQARSRSTPKTS